MLSEIWSLYSRLKRSYIQGGSISCKSAEAEWLLCFYKCNVSAIFFKKNKRGTKSPIKIWVQSHLFPLFLVDYFSKMNPVLPHCRNIYKIDLISNDHRNTVKRWFSISLYLSFEPNQITYPLRAPLCINSPDNCHCCE